MCRKIRCDGKSWKVFYFFGWTKQGLNSTCICLLLHWSEFRFYSSWKCCFDVYFFHRILNLNVDGSYACSLFGLPHCGWVIIVDANISCWEMHWTTQVQTRGLISVCLWSLELFSEQYSELLKKFLFWEAQVLTCGFLVNFMCCIFPMFLFSVEIL